MTKPDPKSDINSPDHRDLHAFENAVLRHQWNPFQKTLRRQHAIEWIAVFTVHRSSVKGVEITHGQMDEAIQIDQIIKSGHRFTSYV